MNKPLIKTAIIGCGRIAALLENDKLRAKPCTHLGAIEAVNNQSTNPTFQIEGLCDIDKKKAQLVRDKWNLDARIEKNYKKLLKNSKYDLVIIATHTNTHIPIASYAMDQGARALVLEKPIGMNLKQAQKFYKSWQKYKIPVWVNFERRYHPSYIWIKSCIQSKALGKIRSIRGRVHTWAPVGPGSRMGTLLHDGIHWLDLLIWYAGKPHKLSPTLKKSPANKKIESSTVISFDYKNFIAILETDSKRKYFDFAMEIDFDKGRILAGNEGHKFYKSEPSDLYDGFLGLKEFFPNIPKENPWLAFYKEIQETLGNYGHDSHYKTNLKDALAGMKIIQECYNSL